MLCKRHFSPKDVGQLKSKEAMADRCIELGVTTGELEEVQATMQPKKKSQDTRTRTMTRRCRCLLTYRMLLHRLKRNEGAQRRRQRQQCRQITSMRRSWDDMLEDIRIEGEAELQRKKANQIAAAQGAVEKL